MLYNFVKHWPPMDLIITVISWLKFMYDQLILPVFIMYDQLVLPVFLEYF